MCLERGKLVTTCIGKISHVVPRQVKDRGLRRLAIFSKITEKWPIVNADTKRKKKKVKMEREKVKKRKKIFKK